MKVSLEKILTVSAADYARSIEMPLNRFNMVGVRYKLAAVMDEFEVPERTIAIVDYKVFPGYAMGTALIKKTSEESDPLKDKREPLTRKYQGPGDQGGREKRELPTGKAATFP